MKLIIFLFASFVVSFFSDIVLYLFTRLNFIPSLRSYYKNQSILKCALDAAITVEIALILTIVLSNAIFGIVVPQTNRELFRFCALAFVIGYAMDKWIEQSHIFGDRLVAYYKTFGSGFWGAIAFIFSILISYFIQKIL